MISTPVTWIIIIGTCTILVYCIVMAFRYWGNNSWNLVSGTVESYDKPTYVDSSINLCFTSVRYSYQVNDEYYSGAWLTPILPSLSALNEFLANSIPIGKVVDIHYKPGKPDRSVLAAPPAAPIKELITQTHFSD